MSAGTCAESGFRVCHMRVSKAWGTLWRVPRIWILLGSVFGPLLLMETPYHERDTWGCHEAVIKVPVQLPKP